MQPASFLKLHRTDVVQRRVQSGLVASNKPCHGFVRGVAPRSEALPEQPLYLQRPEQRLAACVVPAVATPAHRGRDPVVGQPITEVLTGAIAVEDQASLFDQIERGMWHTQTTLIY